MELLESEGPQKQLPVGFTRTVACVVVALVDILSACEAQRIRPVWLLVKVETQRLGLGGRGGDGGKGLSCSQLLGPDLRLAFWAFQCGRLKDLSSLVSRHGWW